MLAKFGRCHSETGLFEGAQGAGEHCELLSRLVVWGAVTCQQVAAQQVAAQQVAVQVDAWLAGLRRLRTGFLQGHKLNFYRQLKAVHRKGLFHVR